MTNIKHKLLVTAVPLLLLGLAGCGASHNTSSNSASSSATSSQTSNKNSASSSSSSESSTNESSDSLSSLQPKQVAAAVLTVGAQSNEAWGNLKDSATNGDGDLQVDLDSDPSDISQTGKGMFYSLSLDGQNGGMINGYTISQDGKSIYLYSEGSHDSGERTISPFKTISTSQVVKAANQGTVNDIASNTTIESE